MGVYIHGMEMPEDGETVSLTICADGLVFEEFKEPGDVFHAVPVPPHGRLGDLDALVDWLKLSYGTSIPIVRGLLFSSIIKEIQEYPSVIPAEQKSKEEDEAK